MSDTPTTATEAVDFQVRTTSQRTMTIRDVVVDIAGGPATVKPGYQRPTRTTSISTTYSFDHDHPEEGWVRASVPKAFEVNVKTDGTDGASTVRSVWSSTEDPIYVAALKKLMPTDDPRFGERS